MMKTKESRIRNLKMILVLLIMLIATSNTARSQKIDKAIQINDSVWFSEKELTVREYNYFLNSMPYKERLEYLPDSSLLIKIDSAFWKYYFNHPAFEDYPMIGINYSQALAFCKWKSKYYNTAYGPQRSYECTLPTSEEWNKVASQGKLGGEYIGSITHPLSPTSRKEKRFLKKYGYLVVCGKEHWLDASKEASGNYAEFTSPVFCTFISNHIYGLAGNVAEMTLDKKVVGGSWKHSAEQCKPNLKIDHDPSVPTDWMGFRYVIRKTL